MAFLFMGGPLAPSAISQDGYDRVRLKQQSLVCLQVRKPTSFGFRPEPFRRDMQPSGHSPQRQQLWFRCSFHAAIFLQRHGEL